MMSNAKVRIVGCGCSHRRDDQVGLRVAQALVDNGDANIAVDVCEAPGADLLTELTDVELLIIVDAARANGAIQPGEWRRLVIRDDGADACLTPLVEMFGNPPESSHLLGVRDALCLGDELKLLPENVWVYAIAAVDFGYGDQLSKAVDDAVAEAATRILTDVNDWLERRNMAHA